MYLTSEARFTLVLNNVNKQSPSCQKFISPAEGIEELDAIIVLSNKSSFTNICGKIGYLM